MFCLPKEESNTGGTEDKPIILTDDEVDGWIFLLSAFYPEQTFNHSHILIKCRDYLVACNYTGEQSLAVLRIAHKYCMKSFEERIISRLKDVKMGFPWIYLLLASRIVDSGELYEQAVVGLSSPSVAMLSLEEAMRVGFAVFYDVTTRRERFIAP
jgi:hypothetical protein